MSSLQALRVSVHNNPEAEADRSYAPWGVEQALSLSCKSARNARNSFGRQGLPHGYCGRKTAKS